MLLAKLAHLVMYTYLALGDSYTIGESVPTPESFPYQTITMLGRQGITVAEPTVIATTGWTTDELATAIRERNVQGTFSIVSLLIGVNNQYRGRTVANYKEEFTTLLNGAIAYAGGNAAHVFVLSIPDWGVTPFAEGRDRAAIGQEIDGYNAACKAIALAHYCHYIDITDSTRANGTNAAYLAADGLHPSGKEYAVWAQRLSVAVQQELKH